MKKLINEPLSVVREMLEGAVATAPGQALFDHENVVVCHPLAPRTSRCVAVMSGGGSGHEPAHAGYVGKGMLTAAVAGDVFTSPSTDAVLAAIHAVAGPAGALVIVKNYTGDRLNFGLAAELARAEGIPTELVVVADDVALSGTVGRARRRGIAGTVLVHKIAGAAAARGESLATVAAVARSAAASVGSMGVALQSCTLPSAAKPNFDVGERDMEIGLGIHGEPGVRRVPAASADEIVETLLTEIAEDMGLGTGTRLVLLVNGLGSTPPMELSILARSALRSLAVRGLTVERVWVGTLLSALDMQGASLSLMVVDDERLADLDAPTEAPAWPGKGRLNASPRSVASSLNLELDAKPAGDVSTTPAGAACRAFAHAAALALLSAEDELTELDARAGDGDLGMSMSRAARAIAALPDAAWSTPPSSLAAMAAALRRAIGGSSGPLYAAALLRAARTLKGRDVDAPTLAKAFEAAVAAVKELGGANAGDRTMIDALEPAAIAFRKAATEGRSGPVALRAAAEAARAGAERTGLLHPRLGRASYLGTRALGVPDGGAVAVSTWLGAMANASEALRR